MDLSIPAGWGAFGVHPRQNRALAAPTRRPVLAITSNCCLSSCRRLKS